MKFLKVEVNNLFYILIINCFLISYFLSGCKSNNKTSSIGQATIPATLGNNGKNLDDYPAPTKESTYPVPLPQHVETNSSAYPPPTPNQQLDESKRFTIDRSFSVGSQLVLGQGFANTSIRIVSVSNVGETLGSGVVKEDGTFELSLSRPLDANETIAIMLSDESQRVRFLEAPGATDIPMLGFVLDIASTNE